MGLKFGDRVKILDLKNGHSLNHQIGMVEEAGKRESFVRFGYSSYRWISNDVLFSVYGKKRNENEEK